LLGRYGEAIELYRKAIEQTPHYITLHIGLTASYAEMGQLDDARTQAAEVLRIDPRFSIGRYAMALTHKQPEHAQRSIEALSAAGLPE
jgi:tetratricopeptide (TPR) repeat protein